MENEENKALSKGDKIGCGLFILFIIWVLFLPPKNEPINQSPVINKPQKIVVKNPKELTKASESRLNNVDIPTLAVQGKLTSDGLTKADIAYWALNSYGYDCNEVKSVKNVNYNKDRDFEYIFDSDIDANGFVKGYAIFVYKDIICTSGTKLKLYKRFNNYPYIVEK